MIKSEVTRHPVAYVILFVSAVVFVMTFFFVWPNRMLERVAVIAYAGFYTAWGVVTHRSKGHLTKEIFYEYGLVALLGALLLLMLTF